MQMQTRKEGRKKSANKSKFRSSKSATKEQTNSIPNLLKGKGNQPLFTSVWQQRNNKYPQHYLRRRRGESQLIRTKRIRKSKSAASNKWKPAGYLLSKNKNSTNKVSLRNYKPFSSIQPSLLVQGFQIDPYIITLPHSFSLTSPLSNHFITNS